MGGTGKTPLVIWLAEQLGVRGLRVAVISRGYGGSVSQRTQGGVTRVTDASHAGEVGDEAVLIHRRGLCQVYVGRDRVAAAQQAIADGAQVLLADDGLQHLRLGRDVEIALIDGQRGLGNGALLPAGPLREGSARLAAVNAVVVTGESAIDAIVPTAAQHMHLAGTVLQDVRGTGAMLALTDFAGQRVHALAGIGNPERFFALLRAARIETIAHAFSDHHQFRAADLDFGEILPILMTEKDAVKCQSFAPAQCWYLPVSARFGAADERALLGRVFMDARLLDILVCPLCKGPLRLADEGDTKALVCRSDRLAFPVRDGIPVMLAEEARPLEPTDPLMER